MSVECAGWASAVKRQHSSGGDPRRREPGLAWGSGWHCSTTRRYLRAGRATPCHLITSM